MVDINDTSLKLDHLSEKPRSFEEDPDDLLEDQDLMENLAYSDSETEDLGKAVNGGDDDEFKDALEQLPEEKKGLFTGGGSWHHWF